MNSLIFRLLILCSLLLAGSSVFAVVNNSPEALLKMKAKRVAVTIKKLRAAADLVDDIQHTGVAYNEIDAREHICYSLGVMLDQEENVRHLEAKPNPVVQAVNSDEAHSLRVGAQSLENFIQAIIRVLSLSHQERVLEWNLDCVGQFKVKGKIIASKEIGAFYQLKHNGKILQILGPIEEGFSDRLRIAIESNPSVRVVALGSGGGLVHEALKAGRYLRSRNLDTTLWNNCFSACPLVFLAGRQRTIISPYPYLGFHKIYTNKGPVLYNSPIYQEVAIYVVDMGASPRYILDKMLSAEPNQMLVVRESEELCQYGLATWVQRIC